jgi:hypothetical protein
MVKKADLATWGAATSGAGAAVLATAATACCAPILAPIIVSVLGVSGAVWAAGLKPYSPYILSGAGLLLVYGFWTVYRRRPLPAGASCPARRPRSARIVLWVSALLWLVAFLFVVGATAVGVAPPSAANTDPRGYEVLGQDLEPFRSDFNAEPDHVRAVLLVGPT